MPMMKTFYDCLCKIESFVAWATLWTMVALIFAAGIARLCLYPINWAIDLGTCLFAWSCFLSADIAWREDKLMNVDILIRKFPENVRRYLRLVNYTILFGFLAYLVIFGIWLSYTTRARTFQGIPGFSYTWVTLSVPVSALLMFINTIIKFKRDIHSTGARDRMGIGHQP
jgi:TRAP-type C4-dicarboxylate transport system permease small subunit